MGEMRMERRILSDLKPAEYNPRIPLRPEDKEYQDIKRSIEDNGYLDPIVINYATFRTSSCEVVSTWSMNPLTLPA